MALSSRVWGAGKLLAPARGPRRDLSSFCISFDPISPFARARSRAEPCRPVGERCVVTLEEIGLTLRVDDNRRVDDKVPAGHVLLQDPPSGLRVRSQRSVHVWISQGAAVTLVPSLLGDTERSARVRLDQDGLTLAGTAEIRTHDYPADAVIAQDPAPTTRGTAVALLVNRGERGASYVMPDLIGVDGERAAEFLRKRGFRVAVVGTQPYPGVPAGIVIRQTPAGGFQIAPGEAMALEVSR